MGVPGQPELRNKTQSLKQEFPGVTDQCEMQGFKEAKICGILALQKDLGLRSGGGSKFTEVNWKVPS